MKEKRGEGKEQSVSQSVHRFDCRTIDAKNDLILLSRYLSANSPITLIRAFLTLPLELFLRRTNSVISWIRGRSNLDNCHYYVLLISFRFPLEIIFRRMQSPKISSIGDARTDNIPRIFFSVNRKDVLREMFVHIFEIFLPFHRTGLQPKFLAQLDTYKLAKFTNKFNFFNGS